MPLKWAAAAHSVHRRVCGSMEHTRPASRQASLDSPRVRYGIGLFCWAFIVVPSVSALFSRVSPAKVPARPPQGGGAFRRGTSCRCGRGETCGHGSRGSGVGAAEQRLAGAAAPRSTDSKTPATIAAGRDASGMPSGRTRRPVRGVSAGGCAAQRTAAQNVGDGESGVRERVDAWVKRYPPPATIRGMTP